MIHFKSIYCIALFLILVSSCKKDDNQVPDNGDDQEENVWHEDTRFTGVSAILLNSHKTEDKLYVLGIHDIFSFSSSEDEKEEDMLPFTPSVDYKFPMAEKFYMMVNTENSTIYLLPYHMRGTFKSGLEINMKEMDEDFKEFDFIYWRAGECIAVTENNYFLVPYRSIDGDIYFFTGKVRFIESGDPEYTTSDYGEYWVDTLFTKKVYFDGLTQHNYRSLDDIDAWKDRFFVIYDDVLFSVDTLGNNTRVDDNFFTIDYLFEKNDTLFALAGRGLMYSQDEGYHWEWINDDEGNDCLALSYITIQDQLVGYNGSYGSNLIYLKSNGNDYNCTELESEALNDKAISSVSELNDSTVYVTTLNGGFYKHMDDFFE